jgi:hypothetical protein
MNVSMANLHIYSSEGEQDKDEEYANAIKEEDAREDGSTINMLSDDKEGEDFLEEDTRMPHNNLPLFREDYDSLVDKVSSGVFDAAHSNKFKEPESFKKQLWNKARPSAKV